MRFGEGAELAPQGVVLIGAERPERRQTLVDLYLADELDREQG